MSQLTIDLALDNYRSTLSQAYNWWSGSIYVNTVPNVSFPTGKKVLLTVNPEKTNMQVVELDWWDSVAKTLNCTWATVKRGEWANYSATDHSIGSEVKISIPYDARDDIKTAVNTKVNTNSTDTDTGKFANATARDAYFTSPVNGNSAYLTAEGKRTDYVGGAWVDRATGSTPNASTTVAGKVEKATSGEVTAWTSTGWTGAELFVWPAELKNVTDWFAATNSQAETWTATWVFINPVQLKTSFWWTPIAWTTITMCSSTTVTTTNSATYIKKYQATIQRSWTYTVTFWIKTWWSWFYYGRIYKNGVAFWTERTSNTTSYDTFNEDLTFAAWDTVELWLKYASWIHTTDCNGISVTYSVWPATTVTTY